MLKFLPFLLVAFLAGCNGSEDFSDADLGGPVIEPSPEGNPFDPNATVTEVIFAAGGSADGDGDYITGVVNNLGYICGGTVNYIPRPGNTQGDGGVELRPNAARCPTDATSIEFFLGDVQAENADTRLYLGKAWLPAESGQGRFQITPADLIESPSRVAATQYQARNIAALLQALDSDTDAQGATVNTPGEIDIPDEVHDLLLNRGAPNPVPPSNAFDHTDYNDFESAWSSWIAALDMEAPGTQQLPNETEAETQLAMTLDRIRAGTFNGQSLGLTEFGFVLQQLGREQDIGFQYSALVFPDGAVLGAGISLLKDGSGDSSVVALESSAQMDAQQGISGWSAREVSADQDDVSLSFVGRVLGTFAYYNVEGENIKSDFEVDYPDSEYPVQPGDEARYSASDTSGNSVTDGLWWLTRTGQVSVDWELEVVQALEMNEADRFYDIEFRRACTDSNEDDNEPVCPTYDASGNSSGGNGDYEIPADEFGENYLETLDVDGADTTDQGIEITHERPKEWGNDLGTTESLRVQILDNGDVITDRDQDCATVDGNLVDTGGTGDGDVQEYRVGFVTRTNRDDLGDPESFNITLLLSGSKPGGTPNPVYAAHDEIPHYAVEVAGRIDVTGDVNRDGRMFKLGDESFADGIRSLWTDFYLPRQKEDDYAAGGEPTLPQQHEIAVSSSGAALGRPVDVGGGCTVP